MYRLPLLLSFWAFVAGNAFAQSPNLDKALELLRQQPSLKTAQLSFLLLDTQTGRELVAQNADMAMTPASVMKLVTTATALEVLGAQHRFVTEFGYAGSLTNGKLTGNIVVRGGGDPCLASPRFASFYADKNWMAEAAAVLAQQISFVSGGLLADASRYGRYTTNPGWTWEDLGNYWGAVPASLSVYDNEIALFFDSPRGVGQPAVLRRTEPASAAYEWINYVVTGAGWRDNAFIFGSQLDRKRLAVGEIPRNQHDFRVRASLAHPADVVAHEFAAQLSIAGLSVGDSVQLSYAAPTDSMVVLHRLFSPPLSDIVRTTNELSVNLYAEHLLLETGRKLNGNTNRRLALEAETAFWKNKGMNTDGFFAEDGSGLSPFNGVNARQLAFVLRYMLTQSANKQLWWQSLPIMAQSGTLRYMGKGSAAAGRVRAKSGSMKRVKSYAGYIETRSGRKLIFVAMANHFTDSSAEFRQSLVNVLSEIVTLY